MKIKGDIEIATQLSSNLEWIYSGMHALGSAIIAHAWIEEMSYTEMNKRFGIYPGDVYNNIYTLEWISYAATRMASYLRNESLYAKLRVLKERIRHGVKTDILRFTSLKGVGRIIGRKLYSAGFRSIKNVAEAEEAELEKIPEIGKKRARMIKKRL